MSLSKKTRAVLWGVIVGAFFGGAWFWIGYPHGVAHPMLLPGESELAPAFSALKSAVVVFIVIGVSTALLVAVRPDTRRKP